MEVGSSGEQDGEFYNPSQPFEVIYHINKDKKNIRHKIIQPFNEYITYNTSMSLQSLIIELQLQISKEEKLALDDIDICFIYIVLTGGIVFNPPD